jgi:DNA invertase Pin-like site-specific DNA recombinase
LKLELNSLTEHIDTDTALGRAMMQIAAIFAAMERDTIRERTRDGIADAKRRGVKFGRKPKLTRQDIDRARKLIAAGERPEDVATSFKAGRSTLYRALAS